MTAKEMMEKARTRCVLDHPFYGILALRLEMREAEWCPTATTNGEFLYYNPKWIESLTIPQTIGLFAHEVMHCALGHMWRGEGKEHDLWNIATDYKINQGLQKAGFELPSCGVLKNEPAWDSLAEEEIYYKIPKQYQKGGKNGKQGQGNAPGSGSGQEQNQGPEKGMNGSDPGGCGGIMQVSQQEDGKAKQDQLKSEWKAAVSNAIHATKNRGDIPGDILLAVKEVLDPPLPWHVLLRDFIEKAARNDYNWTRPNRRYLSQGIVLPSLLSEELNDIIVVDDTSGSTCVYQDRFGAETSAVLAAYKTTIRLIYCDAAVHGEEVYSTEDLPLKLEPKGGGGTDFRPVFDYVEKMGYQVSAMIFFTDLYGAFPDREPDYPVLWVCPTDEVAPFGQTVKFHATA